MKISSSGLLICWLSHAPKVWRLWTLDTTRWAMKGSTNWKMDSFPTAPCLGWDSLQLNCPVKVREVPVSSHVANLSCIFQTLIYSPCHLCCRSCGCGWIYCWESQTATPWPSRERDQDRRTDGSVAGPESQHFSAASGPGQRAKKRNGEHGRKKRFKNVHTCLLNRFYLVASFRDKIVWRKPGNLYLNMSSRY